MAANDTAALSAFAAALVRTGEAAPARARVIVEKVARDIQATAQQLAPVDTGFLRSSIGVEVTSSPGGAVTAVIAPTADYAAYVEYGTSVAPPQPFMGPAFDRHLPRLQAALASLSAGL